MPEQFDLPGFGSAALATASAKPKPERGARLPHSLFFANFPSPADADRIAPIVKALRTQHGLSGKPLAPERLHVTLLDLGGYADGLPPDVVDAALAAAATLSMPCCDIAFDRVLSFAGSNAIVLRSAAANPLLSSLTQALAVAVERAGLVAWPSRTPHMTLLYDPRRVAEQAIETVRWTATEIVLVHSLVGRSRHIRLGQWPLRA